MTKQRFAVAEAGGGDPSVNPHRTMVERTDDDFNHSGWKHRLAFYAYDHPATGTVRFSIGEAGGGDPSINAHRIMIEKSDQFFNHSGWKDRLAFYAFDYPARGTVPFAVGEAHNPHRIMITQSDKPMDYAGWTHRLFFYAFETAKGPERIFWKSIQTLSCRTGDSLHSAKLPEQPAGVVFEELESCDNRIRAHFGWCSRQTKAKGNLIQRYHPTLSEQIDMAADLKDFERVKELAAELEQGAEPATPCTHVRGEKGHWNFVVSRYPSNSTGKGESGIHINLWHPQNAWRGKPGRNPESGSALLFSEGFVGDQRIRRGVAWGDNATGYSLSLTLEDGHMYAINANFENRKIVGSYTHSNMRDTGAIEGFWDR